MKKCYLISILSVIMFVLPLSVFGLDNKSLDIKIPQVFGKIDTFTQGNSDLTVIHIQDAHGNAEAQENIQQIIKSINDQSKIDAVFTESEWSENEIQTYSQFSPQDKKYLADWYTKYGLMHGGYRYKLLDNAAMPYIGCEDKETYIENWKKEIEALYFKDQSLSKIQKINELMSGIKIKIFDHATLQFLQTLEDYKNNKISLTLYISSLNNKAKELNLEITNYVNITKALDNISFEEKIDFTKIDSERDNLINEIEKNADQIIFNEISKKLLAFKAGKLSALNFYDSLNFESNKIKVDSSKYLNVLNYNNLLKMYESIDNKQLLSEVSVLEENIKSKMFVNQIQKDFDLYNKNVDILAKIISLSTNRTDLEYYNQNKPTADKVISFILKVSGELNLNLNIENSLSSVDKELYRNEDFYKLALKRDELMVNNTLSIMNKRGLKTVILVAGGFHTDALIKSFASKNVNTMIVIPRISNNEAINYHIKNVLGEETEATIELKKAGISTRAEQILKSIRSNSQLLSSNYFNTPQVQTKGLLQVSTDMDGTQVAKNTLLANQKAKGILSKEKTLSALGRVNKRIYDEFSVGMGISFDIEKLTGNIHSAKKDILAKLLSEEKYKCSGKQMFFIADKTPVIDLETTGKNAGCSTFDLALVKGLKSAAIRDPGTNNLILSSSLLELPDNIFEMYMKGLLSSENREIELEKKASDINKINYFEANREYAFHSFQVLLSILDNPNGLDLTQKFNILEKISNEDGSLNQSVLSNVYGIADAAMLETVGIPKSNLAVLDNVMSLLGSSFTNLPSNNNASVIAKAINLDFLKISKDQSGKETGFIESDSDGMYINTRGDDLDKTIVYVGTFSGEISDNDSKENSVKSFTGMYNSQNGIELKRNGKGEISSIVRIDLASIESVTIAVNEILKARNEKHTKVLLIANRDKKDEIKKMREILDLVATRVSDGKINKAMYLEGYDAAFARKVESNLITQVIPARNVDKASKEIALQISQFIDSEGKIKKENKEIILKNINRILRDNNLKTMSDADENINSFLESLKVLNMSSLITDIKELLNQLAAANSVTAWAA
ncbi:MAG: hypothetical protein ACD_79C00679G0004 [uncultured bacterium]|nr:MAG: hypothetical protein ACD_79C00679G0004 [uncultured bacterium]